MMLSFLNLSSYSSSSAAGVIVLNPSEAQINCKEEVLGTWRLRFYFSKWQHEDESSPTYQINHLEDRLVVPRLGLFHDRLQNPHRVAPISEIQNATQVQELSTELWP
jgi:hypothetical protein